MNPTTLLSGLGAAITADPATGSASSAGSGDLFLALVAGLLQGETQGTPGSAVPAAPAEQSEDGTGAALPGTPVLATTEPPPAAPEEPATATDDPVATGIDASALQLALGMPPIVAQAAASKPVTATVDGTATPVASVDDAPTAAPTDPLAAAGGSGQAGADAGRSGDPDPNAAPTPSAPTTPDTGVQPAGSTAAPRTEAHADPSPAPAPVTSVPGAATVAPTSAAAAAPTTTADVHRVAGQVFPEVLRASANNDTGTSRVTVKLNPESLGEVRVVLTQRRGGLEVTLAAGSDAQRALSDGAPELRRLLESVGRADSRILIRDLPTGPLPATATPSAPAVRTDVSTDLAGGAWSGAGRPGGEPAPDREHSRHHPGSTNATDGISSAIPASRPTTTTSPGRAGLDLSM